MYPTLGKFLVVLSPVAIIYIYHVLIIIFIKYKFNQHRMIPQEKSKLRKYHITIVADSGIEISR